MTDTPQFYRITEKGALEPTSLLWFPRAGDVIYVDEKGMKLIPREVFNTILGEAIDEVIFGRKPLP